MKKYLIIPMVIFAINAFGQDAKPKKAIYFDPFLRAAIIYPIQFGDNSLNNSHRANQGFEFKASLFHFRNFKFGAGLNTVGYTVTDFFSIGNIGHTEYTSVFGDLTYDFFTIKKTTLSVDAGYGFVRMQQKVEGGNSALQDGGEFRVGTYVDYRVMKRFSATLGAHYIGSNFKIETTKEYEDYFGKASKLQLTLGLKMNF